MFPACSADHNCCDVAETFFGCCTCPEEECAFEAAGAGATAAWLAPSGCSAFAGCGVAHGDDVRVIRSVEDAPAICGLCLCGDLVGAATERSEEHTSELQSRLHLVCRLLLEKKKNGTNYHVSPAR